MNVASGTSLDVGRVLGIVRDRWYIVVGCMLLVTGVAYGYAEHVAKPRFESTALVSYDAPRKDGNPTGGVLPASPVNRENVQTLIAVAGEASIVQTAATNAGVPPQDVRRSVRVQPHGDGLLVDFVGVSDTPSGAAKLANAYARAFVEDRRTRVGQKFGAQIKEKQAELAKLGKAKGPASEDPNAVMRTSITQTLSNLRTDRRQWTESIAVSAEAQDPLEPVWPRTKLTLFAALLVGAGLGAGIALLTARADRKLHGDEFDDLPAPVLVRVPESARAPRATPLPPSQAEPIVADAFAALGARLMQEHRGEGALVILVSSARSGEGKSTVAANLSSALAQGGRRVVLVDADMRKPTQDTLFPALQGRPGLSQVLTRATEVEHSLTLVAPNLAAIASGPRQANASVLLASVSFRQLVDRLSGISEVIVIDAPPVLAVTDALAIAPAANHVLLCARVGASNVVELEETHRRLGAAAAGTPQSIALLGTERPMGYGYDNDIRSSGASRGPAAPMPAARPASSAAASAAGAPGAGSPPMPGSPPPAPGMGGASPPQAGAGAGQPPVPGMTPPGYQGPPPPAPGSPGAGRMSA